MINLNTIEDRLNSLTRDRDDWETKAYEAGNRVEELEEQVLLLREGLSTVLDIMEANVRENLEPPLRNFDLHVIRHFRETYLNG